MRMGAPELPSEEDIQPAHFALEHPPVGVEESDDDAPSTDDSAGYMALGDEIDGEMESTAIDFISDAVGEEAAAEATATDVPAIESADTELQRQVWNEPRPQELQIVLDTEQILQAMQHVKLPDMAVPAWAAGVPEERWKEELLQRIRQRQETTTTAATQQFTKTVEEERNA